MFSKKVAIGKYYLLTQSITVRSKHKQAYQEPDAGKRVVEEHDSQPFRLNSVVKILALNDVQHKRRKLNNISKSKFDLQMRSRILKKVQRGKRGKGRR